MSCLFYSFHVPRIILWASFHPTSGHLWSASWRACHLLLDVFLFLSYNDSFLYPAICVLVILKLSFSKDSSVERALARVIHTRFQGLVNCVRCCWFLLFRSLEYLILFSSLVSKDEGLGFSPLCRLVHRPLVRLMLLVSDIDCFVLRNVVTCVCKTALWQPFILVAFSSDPALIDGYLLFPLVYTIV